MMNLHRSASAPTADGSRVRVQGLRPPRWYAGASVQACRCLARVGGAFFGLFLSICPATAIEPTAEQIKAVVDRHIAAINVAREAVARDEQSLADAKSMKVPRYAAGKRALDAQAKARKEKEKAIDLAQDELSRSMKLLESLEGSEIPRLNLVIDAPSFIVKPGTIGVLPTTRVLQIIDKDRMLVTVGGGELGTAIVMLRISTEGLTDDATLPIDRSRVFVATGTHSYKTVGGAMKTIPVIEEVNVAPIRAELARQRGAIKK